MIRYKKITVSSFAVRGKGKRCLKGTRRDEGLTMNDERKKGGDVGGRT